MLMPDVTIIVDAIRQFLVAGIASSGSLRRACSRTRSTVCRVARTCAMTISFGEEVMMQMKRLKIGKERGTTSI